MKVVIDTNCLIASIPQSSNHYWLYHSFINQEFEWIVSNEIINEYEEKLTDFYSISLAKNVLKLLAAAPNVIQVEAAFKWQLIENDPDDNKFVDISFASSADFLVSNDSDFNILKNIKFPKIKVLKLEEFKKIMKK